MRLHFHCNLTRIIYINCLFKPIPSGRPNCAIIIKECKDEAFKWKANQGLHVVNTQDYTSSGSSYPSHSSGDGGCGGGSVVVYLFEKCKEEELAGLASLFYKTGAQHALRLCHNCLFQANPLAFYLHSVKIQGTCSNFGLFIDPWLLHTIPQQNFLEGVVIQWTRARTNWPPTKSCSVLATTFLLNL